VEQPAARANPFGLSLGPRIARGIAWVVCALAGCGVLVAATVVILALVRTRPLHGAVWLLLAGIPVLVAGVLATILITMRRSRPAAANRRWGPFEDLPKRARLAAVAVAFLLLVSNFTALASMGHPLPPTGHCKYRVSNHGVTCTDEATYYRAGRGEQRYVASWFAFAFLVVLGLAGGELVRRRRED